MRIKRDTKEQAMIEWPQGGNGWKRAWVQHKKDPEKDWAKTGRYINVVRIEGPDIGPAGNATDFPIFGKEEVSDEELLTQFVTAICLVTGCATDEDNDNG